MAVQNAVAASLLAAESRKLVLDTGAADVPDLADLLDGQRWALESVIGEENDSQGS